MALLDTEVHSFAEDLLVLFEAQERNLIKELIQYF
jgi:hypothetical protein